MDGYATRGLEFIQKPYSVEALVRVLEKTMLRERGCERSISCELENSA